MKKCWMIKARVKVKFILEVARKAEMGSRGIALTYLLHGAESFLRS